MTKALVPNLINYGYLSLKTRNAQIFRLKDISDKLGYDAESGQLYEQRMDERIDEAFVLTDEIIELYKSFWIDVEKHNWDKLFELPMPATYVVDTNGKIIFAEAMADYTKRTEPSDIIKVLKTTIK